MKSGAVALVMLLGAYGSAMSNFAYGQSHSNTTPKFAQTRFGLEIRPIIGVRNAEWEFIVNPLSILASASTDRPILHPRKLDRDLFVGLEYYADFGEISRFGRLPDQQHTLFAVTDFKLGAFDVNLGLGYGLTPSSDRFVVKTIVGYAFPAPAKSIDGSERAPTGPVNPLSRSAARTATSY